METTQKKPETEAPKGSRQPEGGTRPQRPPQGTQPRGAKAAPQERRKAQDTGKSRSVSEERPRKPKPASGEKTQQSRTPSAEKSPKSRPAAGGKQAPKKKKSLFSFGKKTPKTSKPAARQERPQRQKSPEPAEEYTHGLPDSVSTKKRAYGQSKPKKKTVADYVSDAVKRSGERKVERIKKRQEDREKGVRKPASASGVTQQGPVVIYTQPAAFNASRFLIHMATVAAVVLALVWGLSVFFKVKSITVAGAEVYSTWAVSEASGIQEGDSLLSFSHARAGAQIKANLPYVKTVRFGIKLPDTVNIIIEEEDVLYAIKTEDGTWWLMTSSGKMIEQANNSVASKYTQILGVTVTEPIPNERAVATEAPVVFETDANGETVPVPVAVTGAARLNTALKIVQALEANDIVGEAASVDVSRMEDIILWYGTQYQVNLGGTGNLDYKIACMNDVILQMQEYQTGVLDISFTIWPNQVAFTPFA